MNADVDSVRAKVLYCISNSNIEFGCGKRSLASIPKGHDHKTNDLFAFEIKPKSPQSNS